MNVRACVDGCLIPQAARGVIGGIPMDGRGLSTQVGWFGILIGAGEQGLYVCDKVASETEEGDC